MDDISVLIYKTAEELKTLESKLKPENSNEAMDGVVFKSFPTFTLYKGLREEELHAYRNICRVFVMHAERNAVDGMNNNPNMSEKGSFKGLSRQYMRILEDLEEILQIPPNRILLERQMALNDPLVQAIASSKVATHRESFFDGMNDISIENVAKKIQTKNSTYPLDKIKENSDTENLQIQNVKDDGRELLICKRERNSEDSSEKDSGENKRYSKRFHMPASAVRAGRDALVASSINQNHNSLLLSKIRRLGKEIEQYARISITSSNTEEVKKAKMQLSECRSQLLKWRLEAEPQQLLDFNGVGR